MVLAIQKNLLSLIDRMIFLCFILSLSIPIAEAQNDKRDYVWLGGYNYDTDSSNNESYTFDFTNGASPKDIRGLIPISFLGNNTSICDKNGNLLYYTNGCHVVGSNHQILPNGSGLNDGEWIEQFRGDTCVFYPTTQDILILPDPGNEENHYIIHKPIEIGEPFYKSLKYSYIDGSLNNGDGDLTIKGSSLMPDIKFLSSYLTAIAHQNNVDWWIVQSDENANLHSILLDENGFTTTNVNRIQEDAFSDFVSASGTAKFSPDGTKYVTYNPYTNLHLFDFDRSDGVFSNVQNIFIEEFPQDVARFSSVEWSPDSRFIYISIQDQLWQVDTWEEDLIDGLILIDVYDGGLDPFQTTFFLMVLAPDCKIYMNSTNGAFSYHVINEPNEKGLACDFVQQGIKLPHPHGIDMPNFPRFRIDEDEKCDPGITSVFGEDIYWRRNLNIYPNPVIDKLTVDLPEDAHHGTILIFNMKGKLVSQYTVESYQINKQIDMSGLPVGTYSVEYFPKKNKKKRIWTSVVMKIN